MTNEEAIEVIKANWPPENYTDLREALTIAVDALENGVQENGVQKYCTYYTHNNKKPCCTHACEGCIWYE